MVKRVCVPIALNVEATRTSTPRLRRTKASKAYADQINAMDPRLVVSLSSTARRMDATNAMMQTYTKKSLATRSVRLLVKAASSLFSKFVNISSYISSQRATDICAHPRRRCVVKCVICVRARSSSRNARSVSVWKPIRDAHAMKHGTANASVAIHAFGATNDDPMATKSAGLMAL